MKTKLHPPPVRADLVVRDRLVRRLTEAGPPVVVVCAPAGYGKTTLLAQSATVGGDAPLAWLSLDESDNDPVVLLSEVTTALGRIAPVDERVLRGLRGSRQTVDRVVLPGLVNALGTLPGLALTLDDVHRVEEPGSLSIIAFLVEHVPPSARLVVATRDSSSLPLGRMRVERRVLELDARELALRRTEIEGLLTAAGVAFDDELLDAVVWRTEGWPVAVSLATHSLAAASDPSAGVADMLAGDDRDIVDYFSSELLSRAPLERSAFLLRTSILERLTAPLCDAVLERDDSASMIAALDDENLFLLPLDRSREWYRYHHLFRDVLRGEFARFDAGAAASLHRRAAEWHDRYGTPEEAVQHAVAGGDMAQKADLVLRHSRRLMNSGRLVTARRWLAAFSDDEISRSAPLALAGAFLVGLLGERDRARRYVALAERAPWHGIGFLGETSRESALALVKALIGWEGVTRMRAHARTAYDLEPVGSTAHEPAALALGLSLLLLGRAVDAAPLLEEAAALGPERASVGLLAFGELVLIALDEDKLAEAEAYAEKGLTLARGAGLEEQSACALLHAGLACLGARRGDARTRRHLEIALPLLAGVAAAPWWSIQTHTMLGRAALTIGDVDMAAPLLQEARRELTRFPDSGVLPRRLAEEEHRLERIRGGRDVLTDGLTNAEQRVLELLPTYLSVNAIAETLHVSASTVKSHQKAIYRKLGAARRADAVATARWLGLLEEEG